MLESDVRKTLQDLAGQAMPTDFETRALNRGQQLRRRRTVGTGFSALAVVAALIGGYAGVSHIRAAGTATPADGTATNCSVHYLPDAKDAAYTVSLSRTDEPPGFRMVPRGNVIWATGQSVPGLPTGWSVDAENNRGDVVGGGFKIAWKYYDGTFSQLPTPAGFTMAQANGIDDSGNVVGQATRPGSTTNGVAVLWPAAQPGTVRVLAPATGGFDTATTGGFDTDDQPAGYAIDDAGTIVGASGSGWLPYVWRPDGTGRALSIPKGYNGARVYAVAGDWAIGQVAHLVPATEESAAPTSTAVATARWNLKTGHVDIYRPKSEQVPYLTADGWGVTDKGVILTSGAQTNSALIRGGRSYSLPLPSGLNPRSAVVGTSISPDGRTVTGFITQWGLSSPSGGARALEYFGTRPVLWRC